MSEMRPGTLADIRVAALAVKGQIRQITGHWSAGRYVPNATDLKDYHVLILQDGSYLYRDDFAEVLAHTWHDNTGNIGVAFAGCFEATTENLGPYAPTEAQIAAMALAVRTICDALEEAVDDLFKTHCEQALIDGYGPGSGDEQTRWDLWFIRDGEEQGTGGDQIRRLAAA